MKVGVISDIHIPSYAGELPENLLKALRGVEKILAAGDFTTPEALKMLAKIAPVIAVYGNMDGPLLRRRLPRKTVVKIGRFRIGIYHGAGHPEGLMERVAKEFGDERVDAVVYGHSHIAQKTHKDGTLFLNPGSPTDKSFAPYNSCAILEINDKLDARIIKLE